ncbi:hypothetical protein [Polaromonas sp.]|uniref:hypothetical protein n=1 Tax=Polaromonas sp. TaxID=1869339 RepID=UPI003266C3AC
MTDEFPEPLTPAGCNLQDFAFMPLDVARLRDSDLASNETPDACWAAVLLWAASWHQVPAASIPNEEKWIAKAAGYAQRGKIDRGWAGVRDGAMRNWIECSDGRLYHPVVAEKAVEAWKAKLAQRHRSECARIKKHNERHPGANVQKLEFDDWLAAGCPQGHPLYVPSETAARPQKVPSETSSKGQGEGQGQGKDSNTPPPPKGGCKRFEEFWNTWPKSERKQDKVKCAQKWRRESLDAVADLLIADIAVKRKTTKWIDGFIEAPLVYLGGRRWEDGVSPDEPMGAGMADPDSRVSIEAEAVKKGVSPWDQLAEQWPEYRARVRAATEKTAEVA